MTGPARLPSTKELRAFEAVARLGSVKAAADHLCVTASALSRRIQALEQELGQPLFNRDPRGLTLTESGRVFAARLSSAFASLSEAVESARAGGRQKLRILAPGLYAYDIIRYLRHFEQAHPNVQLSFDVFPGALGSDARIPDSDIVILMGDGNWPGWECVNLIRGGYGMPLCAPGYLPGGRMVEDPAELARHTWIQIPYFPEIWNRWCNGVGHPGLQPVRYFEVNSGTMAREAALQGLGIWMGHGTPGLHVDPEYAAGRLVLAHPYHSFNGNWGFYLAYRAHSLANPMVPAFRDWLVGGIAMLHEAGKAQRRARAAA